MSVGKAEKAVSLYAGSEVKIDEASEIIVKGFCGENAEYTLDISSGVLTISGSGEMADYYTDCSGRRNHIYWKCSI